MGIKNFEEYWGWEFMAEEFSYQFTYRGNAIGQEDI